MHTSCASEELSIRLQVDFIFSLGRGATHSTNTCTIQKNHRHSNCYILHSSISYTVNMYYRISSDQNGEETGNSEERNKVGLFFLLLLLLLFFNKLYLCQIRGKVICTLKPIISLRKMLSLNNIIP